MENEIRHTLCLCQMQTPAEHYHIKTHISSVSVAYSEHKHEHMLWSLD